MPTWPHQPSTRMVGVECGMSETTWRTWTGGKLGAGHLRRSKGEAHRAEPTFGLCFCGKALKEANGEARRAEPKFRVGFLGTEGPKGEARRAEQNAGASRKRRAFHLLPGLPKIADFSKTGSRNMAQTCAIDSLFPIPYSTSIVLGGLRALLLPVLRLQPIAIFRNLVARVTKVFQLKCVIFVTRARCR